MKPLPPRATSNTNSPTSNMMNIKLQTKSLITSVPTIQYILDPSNKKLQHAKRQEKAQSEETKQASKPVTDRAEILELPGRNNNYDCYPKSYNGKGGQHARTDV